MDILTNKLDVTKEVEDDFQTHLELLSEIEFSDTMLDELLKDDHDTELKLYNHITKYGLSEELLNLCPELIDKYDFKDGISEEGVGLIAKIISIMNGVSESLGSVSEFFSKVLAGRIAILKSYEHMFKVKNPTFYFRHRNIKVPKANDFQKRLDTLMNILNDFLSSDVKNILENGNDGVIKQFGEIGFELTFNGKITKRPESLELHVLGDLGWNEGNIKSSLIKCLKLWQYRAKIATIKIKADDVLKSFKMNAETKENYEYKQKAKLYKHNLAIYTKLINLCVKEVVVTLDYMIRICKVVIKK